MRQRFLSFKKWIELNMKVKIVIIFIRSIN